MLNGSISYHAGHLRSITDLAVYENNIFATSSKDLTIRLWETNITTLNTSNKINDNYKTPLKFPIALKGHKGSINCLAVFGKFLISGS